MRPKHDELIKIVDVPAVLFRIWGVKRGPEAVYKWVKLGRKANAGTRIVKLKTTKLLGSRFTTEAWLRDFVEGIS